MADEEIKNKLEMLEKSYKEGRISEETYKELKRKYEAQLHGVTTAVTAPPPTAGISLGDAFTRALNVCTSDPIIFIPMIISGILSAILTFILKGALLTPFRYGMRPTTMFGYGLSIVVGLIIFVISLIMSGWTVSMVKQKLEGLTVDLNTSFSYTLERLVSLIVAAILVAIIVGIGLVLLIIPGLIALILLIASTQAIIIENAGGIDALKMSYEFARKNFMDMLIFVIITAIVTAILMFIPLIGSLLSDVAMAYFMTVLTMLYYYRR